MYKSRKNKKSLTVVSRIRISPDNILITVFTGFIVVYENTVFLYFSADF